MQNLQNISAILSGTPWGSSSSTTGPNPYGTSGLQTAFGLGSLGLGAYNSGLLGGAAGGAALAASSMPWLAGAGGTAATGAEIFSPLLYGALML